ncbi:hypothetical protein HN51_011849 [Arachis hypogaea]
MVGTWLFAPFLFNPSGFEWQKIVDDLTDWNKWISNRGGIWHFMVGDLCDIVCDEDGICWEAEIQCKFSACLPTNQGIDIPNFCVILVTLIALQHMTMLDIVVCILAFMPTGWGMLQIAQALKPVVWRAGFWGSVKTLARGYENVMGLLLFTPVAFLAWFPFVSEFQTRMLFNQAFGRGLQISRILGGQRKERSSRNKE